MNNFLLSLLVLLSSVSFAKEVPQDPATEKTAEHQGMTAQETNTTRSIREKLMSDKDLSTNAHNIKIITQDSRVFLKGPVASKLEKARVAKLAHEAAEDKKIVNETYIDKE